MTTTLGTGEVERGCAAQTTLARAEVRAALPSWLWYRLLRHPARLHRRLQLRHQGPGVGRDVDMSPPTLDRYGDALSATFFRG